MDNLPNEILFIIFDWVPPIYIYHLGKCNKRLRQLSIFNFNLLLKKRITTLNINTNLIELINKNCVISGSFMLQLLKNVNYYNSDIDIYVKKDYESDIINFLNTNNFILQEPNPNYDFHSNWNVCSFIDSFDNKIDLIITDGDQRDFIKDFDLNIVKNYYDGNIYFNSYLINNKTQVVDINYETLPSKINHFKRIKRINKYLKRGFNFNYLFRNKISSTFKCSCHR